MSAEEFVPRTMSLARLREAASGCRGCELYADATQTVFGAGPRRAEIVLVGEQPGDVEDRRGEPFVGPAGRLLDEALAEAGIRREDTYLTNAVKHFRFKPSERGKRRIHDKPAARHVTACQPWLAAELASVRPRLVVALGAVAASSLFGPQFRVTEQRGQPLPWPYPDGPFAAVGAGAAAAGAAFATIHPSAVLRAGPQRRAVYDGFVADLALVAASL